MSEREQFEQWWASTMPQRYQADALRLLRQSRGEDYSYGLIRAMDQWIAWQASRRAALEEAATICERHYDKNRPDFTRDPYITTLQCAAAIRAQPAKDEK